MRLTMKKVGRLREPGKYRDDAVRGLYLQLKPKFKGKKELAKLTGSWVLRYELNGTEHYVGLGPLSEVDLNRAREDAREFRHLIRKGENPVTAKKAERQKRALETTFEETARAYIERNKTSWASSKHADQWKATLLDWVYPLIGALPVRDINTDAVMKVLLQEPKKYLDKSLWEALPETASRVRGRIERVLDAAKALGQREGENAARWKGHLELLLPATRKLKPTQHHPALPFHLIAEFMAKLEKQEGVAAKALAYCIVTAARTNEVVGAKWDEIEGDVWTIPASRMKAKRPHRVPLSDRALAILESVPRFEDNPFIFPSPLQPGRGLGDGALSHVIPRVGDYRDRNGKPITCHGFRSSFKDWSREVATFPNEVVEAALAHIIGDRTEAAYARGDLFAKRVKLMATWAKYCTTIPGKSEVVDLATRKRSAK